MPCKKAGGGSARPRFLSGLAGQVWRGGRAWRKAGEAAEGGADAAALLLRCAATLALTGICLLFFMILAFALPVFVHDGAGGPFSWHWQPYQGRFGILPMLAGSLLLAGSALLAAWPLALGLCFFLLSSERRRFAGMVRGVVRFMTAVPTVVYGFAAVFLLTPSVRAAFGGSGLCWLTAGFMLTILILPTMTFVLDAGLAPRLERLCPEGLACGFSRFDLLWFFVLPQARKNMFSAAMLGFGRAVGDTLIPLMLAGNAPQVPEHAAQSLRTLTAHMALVTSNEVGGAAYGSLFAAGALLLAINAGVSLFARRLADRPQAELAESDGRRP